MNEELLSKYIEILDKCIKSFQRQTYSTFEFPNTSNREETKEWLLNAFDRFVDKNLPHLNLKEHVAITQMFTIREGEITYEINPKEPNDVGPGNVNLLNEIE